MNRESDVLSPRTSWKRTNRLRSTYGIYSRHTDEYGFRCRYCQAYVTNLPMISGVQNRNHCPYCLWSRHMDLHHAGDRLSACKATMQPIGLSIKPIHDRYGRKLTGELLLIHRCSECGSMSINRIAADDTADGLVEILHSSSHLEPVISRELDMQGIRLLHTSDARLVLCQLFGNSNQ